MSRTTRPSREWLEAEYTVNHRGAPELARMYGCSHSYIYASLKHYGIPTRGNTAAARLRWESGCYDEEYFINRAESMSRAWAEGRMPVMPSGKDSWHWKGGKPERICENCGETFPDYADRHFCSMACRTTFTRGENHHCWRGGIANAPYGPEWTEEFRSEIRARDENTCQVCLGPGHDVHHIDYDKKNTVPENCVTLCKSCHGLTQSGRPYWRMALMGIVEDTNEPRI